MAKIAAGIRTSAEEAVKAYSTALFNDLNHGITPYRSGQARANWTVSINAPTDNFIQLPEAVKSGVYDAAEVADALNDGLQTIQNFVIGDTLWICNAAPYIVRLNQGYSQQAPAGFVEAALQTASEAVKQFGLIG